MLRPAVVYRSERGQVTFLFLIFVLFIFVGIMFLAMRWTDYEIRSGDALATQNYQVLITTALVAVYPEPEPYP